MDVTRVQATYNCAGKRDSVLSRLIAVSDVIVDKGFSVCGIVAFV